jgi:hypothetical protein
VLLPRRRIACHPPPHSATVNMDNFKKKNK